MFKKNKKGLFLMVLAALICTVILLVIPMDADARGFRGGGFRSSRSSWGRSSRSSRSKSSWGSSRSSRSRYSSSRSSSTRYRSAADRKLATKAKSSGTYFKNRQNAVQHFKKNASSKYPSKYSSKPGSRPSHIPSSTKMNGQQYNVMYNPTYGGYGYMYNGSWRFYEVARDTAMLGLLMRRNNYYYDRPYGYRSGSNWFGTIIILGLIGVGVFLWVKSQQQREY